MSKSDNEEKKSKLDWFGKHLNWTWAIMVIICVLAFSYAILLGLFGIIVIEMNILGSNFSSIRGSFWLAQWILGLILLIIGCRKILALKSRSLRWSFLCLVPLGFIAPWILKNKKVILSNEAEDKSKLPQLPKQNITIDSSKKVELTEFKKETKDKMVLSESYDIKVVCNNCDFKGEIYILKGTLLEDNPCPKCGCKQLSK